ncbi:MAG: cupin domain-containing protein [Gammaproteobacteria bacterium]|nr:cupin domain-containing protein [Gammaproteobacteria bacterium]
MAGHAEIIVLQSGEGARPDLPNMIQTIKVSGEDVEGEFAMWEAEIKGGPGPHIHHTDIETFYVLNGSVEFRLGDDITILSEGGFALIPRGQVHSFKTLGEDPVKMLVMVLPAGFEHAFEEMQAMRSQGMEIDEMFKVVEDRFNTTFLTTSNPVRVGTQADETEQ